MLPPIETSLLESKQCFSRLHNRITSALLDSDGSTKSTNLNHVSTTKALQEHQIQVAKEQILRRTISDLVGSKRPDNDPVISASLRDLIYTIYLYISEGSKSNLSNDDHDLMAPEIEDFRDQLPHVSDVLCEHLKSEHGTLLRITSHAIPVQQESRGNLGNASLQDLMASLQPQTSNPDLQSTFNTLLELLPLQITLLATQITHLERHTHGILSRHSLARASHLSTVASALALKTQVLYLSTLKSTYSGDIQNALKNYSRDLMGKEQSLKERGEVLSSVLDEYKGVALEGDKASKSGSDVMRQLGLKYGEILKEIDETKVDIRKLETEGGDVGRQKQR